MFLLGIWTNSYNNCIADDVFKEMLPKKPGKQLTLQCVVPRVWFAGSMNMLQASYSSSSSLLLLLRRRGR